MSLSTALLSAALGEPTNALEYRVTQTLAGIFPDRFLLCTQDSDFDVAAYAAENPCELSVSTEPMPLVRHVWYPQSGVSRSPVQSLRKIRWENLTYRLFSLEWSGSDGGAEEHHWLLAEDQAAAERFFDAVCAWNHTLRGEILVFSGGCWHKSESLFRSIQNATFDNLILPPELRDEIQADLSQFFAARDVYARYRIPWKRGILLVGPPGNGKTHTIKALVNWLGQPCLYVKSFRSRYETDHNAIRAVFQRARETTPCLLVLEDLDSLLNDENRSFFLNELDGFAANTGIVLIATTNHPDRLDPAIVDRPSRFDRKYHFALPGTPERVAYLALWNDSLEPEMRLENVGAAAALTDGFSFAYLKELFVSAMMRWMNAPVAGTMEAVFAEQVHLLRGQMVSKCEVSLETSAPPPTGESDD